MLHISKCFDKNISDIQIQSEKYRELEIIIENFLPEDMKNTCKIASFNNGCLILNVKDSVWATQLRFMLPDLRDYLRKENNLYQLSSIKININRELLITPQPKFNNSKLKPSPWKSILDFLLSGKV
jgi:hypothetical protein